jgi:hypothetical protein
MSQPADIHPHRPGCAAACSRRWRASHRTARHPPPAGRVPCCRARDPPPVEHAPAGPRRTGTRGGAAAPVAAVDRRHDSGERSRRGGGHHHLGGPGTPRAPGGYDPGGVDRTRRRHAVLAGPRRRPGDCDRLLAPGRGRRPARHARRTRPRARVAVVADRRRPGNLRRPPAGGAELRCTVRERSRSCRTAEVNSSHYTGHGSGWECTGTGERPVRASTGGRIETSLPGSSAPAVPVLGASGEPATTAHRRSRLRYPRRRRG